MVLTEGNIRIEVWNAAATARLAVIMTATSFTRTRKLNEISTASFTFPSTDPAGAQIGLGKRYRVYIANNAGTVSYLSEWIHNSHEQDAGGETPQYTVRLDATLKELARKSAKFNRAFTNQKAVLAAGAVIDAYNETDPYLGAPLPWKLDPYDPLNELGVVSMEVQGQSCLEALDAVRKLVRASFRQTGVRTIQFGTFANITLSIYDEFKYGEAKYLGDFGSEPAYYASNVEQMTPELDRAGGIVVTGCRIVQQSDKVVNRVIVLGSGDGLNQMTLQATYGEYPTHKPAGTPYSYAVQRAANPDNTGSVYYVKVLGGGSGYTSVPTVTFSAGVASARAVIDGGIVTAIAVTAGGTGYTTPPGVTILGGGGAGATAEACIGTYYYYLEDTASIDVYGLYEAVIAKGDIRPYTNSDQQILYASDALYAVGCAYLDANNAPATVYAIEVVNFPTAGNVGRAIRFRYQGWVSVEGTATRYINVDTAAIVLDLEETWTDGGTPSTRLLISTNGERGVSDTDVILGMQREINGMQVRIQPYPSRETINKEREIDVDHPFEFQVPIEDDVLRLIHAELQFVTRPFRSTVNPDLSDSPISVGNGGRTTEFVYTWDGSDWVSAGYPGKLYLTEPPDASGNVGRASHMHGFPIQGGVNLTGASTAGVPDAWYMTWVGGDLFVGSAYGVNNPPAWGGQYYTFGEGAARGYSAGTEHYHRYYLTQHQHALPALGLTGSISYGIYDDSDVAQNTPSGILVYLDGVLVAGDFLDGNGQTRARDLTSAFQNAASGLRKTHTIRVTCTSGRGMVEVSLRLYVALQATVGTVSFGT
jgi:hypothetical protein